MRSAAAVNSRQPGQAGRVSAGSIGLEPGRLADGVQPVYPGAVFLGVGSVHPHQRMDALAARVHHCAAWQSHGPDQRKLLSQVLVVCLDQRVAECRHVGVLDAMPVEGVYPDPRPGCRVGVADSLGRVPGPHQVAQLRARPVTDALLRQPSPAVLLVPGRRDDADMLVRFEHGLQIPNHVPRLPVRRRGRDLVRLDPLFIDDGPLGRRFCLTVSAGDGDPVVPAERLVFRGAFVELDRLTSAELDGFLPRTRPDALGLGQPDRQPFQRRQVAGSQLAGRLVAAGEPSDIAQADVHLPLDHAVTQFALHDLVCCHAAPIAVLIISATHRHTPRAVLGLRCRPSTTTATARDSPGHVSRVITCDPRHPLVVICPTSHMPSASAMRFRSRASTPLRDRSKRLSRRRL